MKRRDLAIQYFPGKKLEVAVRCLRRWIYNCPDLVQRSTTPDKDFPRGKGFSMQLNTRFTCQLNALST